MKTLVRPAISLFVLLSAHHRHWPIPLLVTGDRAGGFLLPAAAGSLIVKDGKPVGSALIGQNFTDPKYFWGRPSATSPQPYNGTASGGSNQGPLNPALVDAVKGRIDALKAADPGNKRRCRPTWSPLRPAAWIRTSVRRRPSTRSSGSPGSRSLTAEAVATWWPRHTEGRQLGLFRRAARQCAGTQSGA